MDRQGLRDVLEPMLAIAGTQNPRTVFHGILEELRGLRADLKEGNKARGPVPPRKDAEAPHPNPCADPGFLLGDRGTTRLPLEDRLDRMLEGIVEDIMGRRGLDRDWLAIHVDDRVDILASWKTIIRSNL